jgi:hypothetical protein
MYDKENQSSGNIYSAISLLPGNSILATHPKAHESVHTNSMPYHSIHKHKMRVYTPLSKAIQRSYSTEKTASKRKHFAKNTSTLKNRICKYTFHN